MRQMILVLKRQQPFLLFFLILVTLSGLGVVLAPSKESPGQGMLPPYVSHTWGWILLFTGVLGLSGVACQRWFYVRGVLILRGSLMMQAGAVTAYSGFLVGFQVPQWYLSVMAASAWVWACLAEARLLRKDLVQIEEVASQ